MGDFGVARRQRPSERYWCFLRGSLPPRPPTERMTPANLPRPKDPKADSVIGGVLKGLQGGSPGRSKARTAPAEPTPASPSPAPRQPGSPAGTTPTGDRVARPCPARPGPAIGSGHPVPDSHPVATRTGLSHLAGSCAHPGRPFPRHSCPEPRCPKYCRRRPHRPRIRETVQRLTEPARATAGPACCARHGAAGVRRDKAPVSPTPPRARHPQRPKPQPAPTAPAPRKPPDIPTAAGAPSARHEMTAAGPAAETAQSLARRRPGGFGRGRRASCLPGSASSDGRHVPGSRDSASGPKCEIAHFYAL